MHLPNVPGKVLVTSAAGEWIFLNEQVFEAFISGNMDYSSNGFLDLVGKNLCFQGDSATAVRLLTAKHLTKKAFLRHGPSMHIFVVTLRCDHSCQYCQVSRRGMSAVGVDMTRETAMAAIDRMFESDNPSLTVEFQGGEPLLAFDTIRLVTEEIGRRNIQAKRKITFSLTSTLHQLTATMAEFFKDHCFQISVSLDGPQALHEKNRPKLCENGYQQTLSGLQLAREGIGADNVAALTTLTRESLGQPEAIVDTYISQGFRSIFLRPLPCSI